MQLKLKNYKERYQQMIKYQVISRHDFFSMDIFSIMYVNISKIDTKDGKKVEVSYEFFASL